MFLKKNKTTKQKSLISFNIKPVDGPWGGSNQFMELFTPYLELHGYEISYKLHPKTKVIWIIDPRRDSWSSPQFSLDEAVNFKKINSKTLIIHRANNCDLRKKDSSIIDPEVIRGCELSDKTIFISQWLRDYFIQKKTNNIDDAEVIWNAGNTQIFHPRGSENWVSNKPLKIVTHHWSDNMMKGFDVYQLIDEWIDARILKNAELTIIGRWPSTIKWKAAKLIQPLKGEQLATELRNHHLYITASRWEPGGMHFLEGMQCGLPVMGHKDGGGIVEIVKKFGIVFDEKNLLEKIEELKNNYQYYRRQSLLYKHDGEILCNSYRHLMEKWMIDGEYFE